MMLVRCSSGVPPSHRRAQRGWRRSRPRHHRNRVPSGPLEPAVRQAKRSGSIWPCSLHPEGRSIDPDTMQHRRARATIARFRPRRLATWDAHVRSALPHSRFSMIVAAWHRARLKFTSPALVMPPETSRSSDWLREGIRPTQGPIFLDDRKRNGLSTADRKVSATTAPTPGMVISHRQTGPSEAI